MLKYNNKCSDNESILISKNIYDNYIKDTIKPEKNYINEKLNSYLNNFNIDIKDIPINNELSDDDHYKKNSPPLCSMVDKLYDSDKLSDSLTKELTDKYGECIIKNNKPGFQNLCRKSCSDKYNELKPCSIYNDISNECKRENTFIFKNGLYYNCLSNNDNTFTEEICKPINNICNEEKRTVGLGKNCSYYNKMENPLGSCESYYMKENGNYYNCIETENGCNKTDNQNNQKMCVYKDKLMNYDNCY